MKESKKGHDLPSINVKNISNDTSNNNFKPKNERRIVLKLKIAFITDLMCTFQILIALALYSNNTMTYSRSTSEVQNIRSSPSKNINHFFNPSAVQAANVASTHVLLFHYSKIFHPSLLFLQKRIKNNSNTNFYTLLLLPLLLLLYYYYYYYHYC
jgi:hypothetical protein